MGNVWMLKQKNNQVQWKQQFPLINNQVSWKKEIQNSSYLIFSLQILCFW
jgi:hypothetical protein